MFYRYTTIGLIAVAIYAYSITAIATYQMWGVIGLMLHLAVGICIALYLRVRENPEFKIHKIQK